MLQQFIGVPFILACVFGAGWFCSKVLLRQNKNSALDNLFLGTSLITIITYLMGLSGLLTRVTLKVFLLFSCLFGIIGFIYDHHQDLIRNMCSINIRKVILVIFLLIPWLALYFAKVVNPAEFSNDAVEHYLPYFSECLDSNSTRPNDVWYQFFYSKGGGLFLLPISIFDIFSGAIVGIILLFLTTLIIYKILSKCVKSKYLSKTLFFVAPTIILFSNASLRTIHVGFVYFIILFLYSLLNFEAKNSKLLNLAAIAAVLYNPQTIVFLIPASFIFFMHETFSFRNENIISFNRLLTLYAIIGFVCLTDLLVNWAFTGLYFFTPHDTAWRIGNHFTWAKTFSPYIKILFIEGCGAPISDISWKFFDRAFGDAFLSASNIQIFKFIKYPLIIGSYLIFLILYFLKNENIKSRKYFFALNSILLTIFLFQIKTWEIGSSNRILTFFGILFFLPLIMCLQTFSNIAAKWFKNNEIFFSGSLIILLCLGLNSNFKTEHIQNIKNGALKFLIKKSSLQCIAEGPFGLDLDIYEACRDLQGKILYVGRKDSIFHLHVLVKNFKTEPSSTSFGKKWHEIMFENPDSAFRELKKAGFSWIIVDQDASTFGCFPFSIFFSSRYFLNFSKQKTINQKISIYELNKPDNTEVPNQSLQKLWEKIEYAKSGKGKEKNTEIVFWNIYQNILKVYLYNKSLSNSKQVIRPPNLSVCESWEGTQPEKLKIPGY